MGLDTVELVMDVEDHFGIVLTSDECEQIRTVGDLADLIFSRVAAKNDIVCPTLRAYYLTRATLRTAMVDPHLKIRPSSKLEVLIPKGNRKAIWNSIRSDLNYSFPNLRLRRSTSFFRMCVVVAILIALVILFPASKLWLLLIPVSVCIAIAFTKSMNCYGIHFPDGYQTLGDLAKQSTGVFVSTKLHHNTTKEQICQELITIVTQQFSIPMSSITLETRFTEDLHA